MKTNHRLPRKALSTRGSHVVFATPRSISIRPSKQVAAVLLGAFFLAVSSPSARALDQHASGGGTYFVEPGIRSEFQFNQSHVQCKIGHAVMADGTTLQMFMASETIDSVVIDSVAKTVVVTGTMVSIVRLRFASGGDATLTESVPFVMFGQDNGIPGADGDVFSLTVLYADTPDLDQFDLFGSPATFAGTLATGNIEVN
jgi:hypothetical protein